MKSLVQYFSVFKLKEITAKEEKDINMTEPMSLCYIKTTQGEDLRPGFGHFCVEFACFSLVTT